MSKKKYNLKHPLKQFRLSNGDEIVADVIEWNAHEHDEIVVKNAMKLMMYENSQGDKYFSFRPFMIYQEGEEDLVVLMQSHLVSIAIPTETLLVQYRIAVKDMNETHLERLKGISEEQDISSLQRMTRETLEKMKDSQLDLETYLEELESTDIFLEGDSDSPNNVIDMFTKRTLH